MGTKRLSYRYETIFPKQESGRYLRSADNCELAINATFNTLGGFVDVCICAGIALPGLIKWCMNNACYHHALFLLVSGDFVQRARRFAHGGGWGGWEVKLPEVTSLTWLKLSHVHNVTKLILIQV